MSWHSASCPLHLILKALKDGVNIDTVHDSIRTLLNKETTPMSRTGPTGPYCKPSRVEDLIVRMLLLLKLTPNVRMSSLSVATGSLVTRLVVTVHSHVPFGVIDRMGVSYISQMVSCSVPGRYSRSCTSSASYISCGL